MSVEGSVFIFIILQFCSRTNSSKLELIFPVRKVEMIQTLYVHINKKKGEFPKTLDNYNSCLQK
jgi:hypothetical protein